MEKIYGGRFVSMVRKEGWEYATRENITGIVLIVPITDEGEIVLNEQFRIPVGKRVIELPAGLVGDESGQEAETLEEGARRELHEETGYDAERLELVTSGPPSAGITDEMVSIYLATGLTKSGEGGGTESEGIVVHRVPLGEIDGWLQARVEEGLLIDPKIFIGLYFAWRHGLCGEGSRRQS